MKKELIEKIGITIVAIFTLYWSLAVFIFSIKHPSAGRGAYIVYLVEVLTFDEVERFK